MVEIDCSNHEFTCPKCGSHRVRVFESDLYPKEAGLCAMCVDCGFGRSNPPEEVRRIWEIKEKDLVTRTCGEYSITEKFKTKHRVIRTYNSDMKNRPYESLVINLNQGWKVIMCNPIGNELEYILEKEEDLDND